MVSGRAVSEGQLCQVTERGCTSAQRQHGSAGLGCDQGSRRSRATLLSVESGVGVRTRRCRGVWALEEDKADGSSAALLLWAQSEVIGGLWSLSPDFAAHQSHLLPRLPPALSHLTPSYTHLPCTCDLCSISFRSQSLRAAADPHSFLLLPSLHLRRARCMQLLSSCPTDTAMTCSFLTRHCRRS